MRVPIARRILEALAGVDAIFGLPGVHNLAFWREAGEGLPRIIGVRHEQTAVYAADGYARRSGRLGVALTTTGPGAANAVGAFGEAAASGSPVLLIASEIATALAAGTARGALHESRDQGAIFAPLAKAVFRPRTPEEVAAAVAEAMRTAMTSPRGPVYLDVPVDVLTMDAPEIRLVPPTRVGVADLTDLADLIAASPRTVIWAGGGVVQADGGAALDALARRLAAPVVTTYAARGVLPPGHPCVVGLPPHEPAVAGLIGGADLLLAIGSDLDGMNTRNWRMAMPPRLATVNCEPGGNYRPDVAVLADARLAMEALTPLVEQRPAGDLTALRAKAWRAVAADERHAEPLRYLATLDEVVTAELPVVADMAIPGYWFGGYGTVHRPRQLQYPVGWGTLGFALPAAIGAAVAGGPTLAVCGDGGIMFALGELATIAQERLPVTVLVVADGGYGMLRYDQDHAGDPHRGVDLLAPHWTTLAAAFGIPCAEVDGVGDELGAALRNALSRNGPALVVAHAAMIPPRTTSPRWFD
ncbi:MAG: thiamine pyrophosphate-binding protein [Actinophytocola sp.]|uniref:thiamine pyrophosphate-binding protein n=1 Tax=Actinophytocola sp. TaxID=1872138 RepID=UPI001321A100|nr:thiamine pyrophosphate-binding protein [Actinophytocola sp.]MPZ85420.1 thiamine pyrophosphate-binding protein [Actinophytocola sp.]